MSTCPFCSFAPERLWIGADHAVALPDEHPVTEGHTLVIPRKHVTSIYELTIPEQQGIWKLVAEVRERLLASLKPDGFNNGFNNGFNDGLAAGQTVIHAHVHVIRRRNGDVADPRGGIRWVIADNAPYWKK